MADISFLRLHPDIEVAQDLGESPHARLRITPQIQLLPYDPQPYQQITFSDLPLTFGNDYIAYIVGCANGATVDVTDHIILSAPLEGQIVVKIAYLPYDFGNEPVYLRIDRYGDGLKNYYSNKFLVTANNAELTSRIDYVNRGLFIPGFANRGSEPAPIFFQSIRLQFYFDNPVDATEVENYYQISTSQTVNPRVSIKEYRKWKTQLFNGWATKLLAKALYDGKCYINQTRNYIVEGFERTDREGMSNFSEQEFLTDPDDNDKLTIIPLIIGDDWQTIPFLASSDQLASADFLISQEFITIPT